MFIGHFAVGMAAKKVAPQLSLGLLFVACQLLDLVWPVLVLLGIEQVSVDHSATVVTPLDFIHYPYSHSLLMTSIYSVGFGLLAYKVFKSTKAGIVIGLVVLSHWILDFVTHRPDLPLVFAEPKLGLGMWNFLSLTLVVEVGIFAAGAILYLKAARLKGTKAFTIFTTLIGFLLLVYAGNIFGPKPPEETPAYLIAGPALSMWLIVAWAYWLERKPRRPMVQSQKT